MPSSPPHAPLFDLVDSHCHLDFPNFQGNLPAVIARAQAAGVSRMLSICTKLRHEPDVRAIAERFKGVFYAVGTHPMSVDEEPMVRLEQLIALSAHPKMIGIGESGLDYHYSAQSAAVQKQSLRIHINAAQESGLPLIIHARAADEDMIKILTQGYQQRPFSCVMHCFSSGAKLARVALDLGFYLSMSGIVTFKNSTQLRDIFVNTPLDRILVETDSPYLAPEPHRGKSNEPAFVTHTAAVGAALFGYSLEEFAAQSSANFERLFSKVKPWQAKHG